MMAAEAGKDVYSEKPCGLTIDLCQQLDETIRDLEAFRVETLKSLG